MSCRGKGGASGKSVELGNCGIDDTTGERGVEEGGKNETFEFRKRIATSKDKYDGVKS